ncbi:MAG: type II CRISPR-associated endonuclease Cas1 [Prevotellaceae bacterium]|jgi:CRISPR-associated protein Cas1|nr:type II CRISPR-associated endonuclease Cas1 [Prevotellaceae bacterium]
MIKRTLYFGNPAYLSMKERQLVIKLPEVENNETLSKTFKNDNVKTVPIEDIGVIVLDNNQITITHGLIEALLANNCALITCDSRRMPVGLHLPLSGNTLQSERFQAQIEASLPLKKQLWQQTVQAKIINQAFALKSTRGVIVKNMHVWAGKVKSGDSENLEARAAAYYWSNLFPDFTRGREEEPPNNLLNYGYAVLRAVVARSLVASGLLPTLGIHHHNRYNAYCLADDIMEPYRPFVDRLVVEIVDVETKNLAPLPDNLSKEMKAKLLEIPVLDVFIDGKHSPLMIAAGQTTASLAKCYLGELRKISYPHFEN